LGSKVLNKMLQELISKMKTVGSASENTQKIQDDLAKVKISIYENDYNNGKQERAIQMLENLIKNKEVQDPALLSESYLKLSKWHFDYKDQQVKHQVVHQNNTLLSKYNQDNIMSSS